MNLYTEVAGEKSGTIRQTVGTKQGCTISPIIFNVFFNSVGTALESIQHQLHHDQRDYLTQIYADDTQTATTVYQTVSKVLHVISTQVNAHNLILNKSKTEVMVSIGHHHEPINRSLMLEGHDDTNSDLEAGSSGVSIPSKWPFLDADGTVQHIPVVRKYVYLGYHVSDGMNINSTIEAIIAKTYSKDFTIYSNTDLRPMMKINLLKSNTLPKLLSEAATLGCLSINHESTQRPDRVTTRLDESCANIMRAINGPTAGSQTRHTSSVAYGVTPPSIFFRLQATQEIVNWITKPALTNDQIRNFILNPHQYNDTVLSSTTQYLADQFRSIRLRPEDPNLHDITPTLPPPVRLFFSEHFPSSTSINATIITNTNHFHLRRGSIPLTPIKESKPMWLELLRNHLLTLKIEKSKSKGQYAITDTSYILNDCAHEVNAVRKAEQCYGNAFTPKILTLFNSIRTHSYNGNVFTAGGNRITIKCVCKKDVTLTRTHLTECEALAGNFEKAYVRAIELLESTGTLAGYKLIQNQVKTIDKTINGQLNAVRSLNTYPTQENARATLLPILHDPTSRDSHIFYHNHCAYYDPSRWKKLISWNKRDEANNYLTKFVNNPNMPNELKVLFTAEFSTLYELHLRRKQDLCIKDLPLEKSPGLGLQYFQRLHPAAPLPPPNVVTSSPASPNPALALQPPPSNNAPLISTTSTNPPSPPSPPPPLSWLFNPPQSNSENELYGIYHALLGMCYIEQISQMKGINNFFQDM